MLLKKVFERLPSALLDHVFDKYLDLKDVVRADSAMCHSASRHRYLNMLYSTTTFHFPYNGGISKHSPSDGFDSIMDWLISRNVKLFSLTLTNCTSTCVGRLKQYLSIHGKLITTITLILPHSNEFFYDCRLDIISALCEYCQNVCHFNCCSSLTPEEYDCILKAWSETLNQIVLHSISLTTLLLIGKSCQGLKEIRLWNPPKPYELTNGGVQELNNVCPNAVTHIYLNCYMCTKGMRQRIASASCSYLKIFDFSDENCTDQGFATLAMDCPHLTEITIKNNSNISDAGVVVLARFLNLETIRLENVYKVSDTSVALIIQRCSRSLHTLNVRNCPQISGKSLFWSGASAGFLDRTTNYPQLKMLFLENISSVGAITMIQDFPALEYVNIAGCSLSDNALKMLAPRCPNLRIVRLGMIREVTDDALIALAIHCPNITELYLVGTSVTRKGLEVVAAHCHKLKGLCVSTTVGSVDALSALFSSEVRVTCIRPYRTA